MLLPLSKLEKLFSEITCDALLIENSMDLLYLLGFPISTGTLLLYRDGGYLIVDGRYFEQCIKKSPFPVLLLQENSLSTLLNELSFISTLGFASQTTSYARYLSLLETLKKGNRTIELKPIENPLICLRKIKSSTEIHLLKQAAELGSRGYDFVRSTLKENISEKEVALELELFWKQQGADGLAFDPIIAFGANSSMPHYRAGTATLKQGDAVLIDIGVTLAHYHSDMTRTLFFGEPNPLLQHLYTIVLQAQQAALEICRAGITVGAVDEAARNIIVAAGYGEQFPHSLGHGIGLEVHEFPLIRNTPVQKHVKLEPGMVVTIEPGIYLADLGGIRIEDTILIVDDGYENLTKRSKELLILK